MAACGRPVMVVIPCYNEARRLDEDCVRALVRRSDIGVLLVDDGSTDATPDRLTKLSAEHPAIGVLTLPFNVGKAEAVRQGLLAALRRSETRVVGYLDADFATPPPEFLTLVDAVTSEPRISVVMGARVALLGREISRSPARHYLGRVFATLATIVLQLPAYDTQCGAKVFRAGAGLRDALRAPFSSRWIFDVELLGRLATGSPRAPAIPLDEMLEIPLRRWTEVKGSKLRMRGRVLALYELAALWRRLVLARRALVGGSAQDETLSRVDRRSGAATAPDDESGAVDIDLLVIEEEIESVAGAPTVHTVTTVGHQQSDDDIGEDPVVVGASQRGRPLDDLEVTIEGQASVVEGSGEGDKVRNQVEVPLRGDGAPRVLEPTAAFEDSAGQVDQHK
jgi:dolichyl-phosphate beta-glucosyltransferase